MVNLQIVNKKGEYETMEVKFSSFWGAWVLAYLATFGVIFGTAMFLALVFGLFGG